LHLGEKQQITSLSSNRLRALWATGYEPFEQKVQIPGAIACRGKETPGYEPFERDRETTGYEPFERERDNRLRALRTRKR